MWRLGFTVEAGPAGGGPAGPPADDLAARLAVPKKEVSGRAGRADFGGDGSAGGGRRFRVEGAHLPASPSPLSWVAGVFYPSGRFFGRAVDAAARPISSPALWAARGAVSAALGECGGSCGCAVLNSFEPQTAGSWPAWGHSNAQTWAGCTACRSRRPSRRTSIRRPPALLVEAQKLSRGCGHPDCWPGRGAAAGDGQVGCCETIVCAPMGGGRAACLQHAGQRNSCS